MDRAFTVEDERFHGRIIPTEYGNMAIIGEPGEVLNGLQAMVERIRQIAQISHC